MSSEISNGGEGPNTSKSESCDQQLHGKALNIERVKGRRYGGNGERSNVCFDWKKGMCNRPNCRFDHFEDDSVRRSPIEPKSQSSGGGVLQRQEQEHHKEKRPNAPRSKRGRGDGRPSYFIALRFQSGALNDAVQGAQDKLTELCPAVATKGLISMPKIHITLGLVRLDPKNIDLRNRFAKEFGARLASFDVRSLSFRGIGYFPNDEGEKRVAYLEPTHDESLGRLQDFSEHLCEELNRCFHSEDVEVKFQDIPHLTVWKDKPILPASIASSMVIDAFSADLMSIELMKIGSTDSDGGYKSFGGRTL